MRRPTPLMLALALALSAHPARANPTGPTVVNGQVTINQAGNLLSITNSPNAIINWQSFSIGANEITRFTQQSAASAILNRVVGAGGPIDPSVILGALQSNGRVFLLNPSGIVFGAGAQIDVAGLVASSLNLSNSDFLGGRLRFTEVPGAGSVVNQGAINAASGGQVYLVGPSVTNSGIITSSKGEVILAAGNSVELVNPGTPNLRVEITAPDNEAKNLGSIVAEAGRIGIYAGLINHSGTIRADSAVATGDGRIILKATKSINVDPGSVTTANGDFFSAIEISAGDNAVVAGALETSGHVDISAGRHVLIDAPVWARNTAAINTDLLDVNAPITAEWVAITGMTANRAVDVVAVKGGPGLELTPAEIGLISAKGLTLGDVTNTGSISITAQPDLSSIVNLQLNTSGNSSFNSIDVNAPVSVDGTLGFSTATLNIAAPIRGGALISANADSIAMSAGPGTVNAPWVILGPRNVSMAIDIGGMDAPGTMGINATHFAALATPFLQFGQSSGITVSAMPNLGSTSLLLRPLASATISVNAPIATTGNVELMAKDIALNATVEAANVRLVAIGPPSTIDLGTLGAGAFMGFDAASLGRISATNSVSVISEQAGTIRVSAPVTFNAPHLVLWADRIDVNSALSLPGSITLLGNSMGLANTVSSTGGGTLTVGPRTASGSITLGPGSGPGLVLSTADISRFSTAGTLRFMTDGNVHINAPVNGGAFGALSLYGWAGITQAAGSAITANQLSLYSHSSMVNFAQDNRVGVLSAFVAGTLDFTNQGSLAVGAMVDRRAGLQGANVVLRSDDLVLAGGGTIGAIGAILAPRSAGAAMNLGSNIIGTYGLDASELAQVTSPDLTLGNSTTGRITVSAPMARLDGSMNILTAPFQTVDVNGALSAPSGVQIDSGTINVTQPITASLGSINLIARAPDTLNINAPITAWSSVGLHSDAVNITAPMTAGSVIIAPVTMGRPTSLGIETAGTLSLTQGELTFITTDTLTIGGNNIFGPTAGPITIGAPLDVNVDTLNLVSTRAISQDVDAPIRLTRFVNGHRIGNLDVRTTGTGNGNASINLPAANEVPGVLSFSTQGTNNDVDFTSALPMSPESIINYGVSGKVSIAPFAPPPPPLPPVIPIPEVAAPPAALEEQAVSVLQAQVVSAVDTATGINDTLAGTGLGVEEKKKTDDEEKKKTDDEEKKQQEGE